MAKTVEEMKQQRRELDRKIRAAKRAEAKAAKEAKVSAQQRLGAWLAGFADADTAEDVEAIQQALETEQGRRALAGLVGADTTSAELPRQPAESSDSPMTNPGDTDAGGRPVWA
nr:Uncharacterised protein [Streptococcus thermophilus]